MFRHFIACGVWEAAIILDALLKNESDIQPDTVHADTQGQSGPVFGLAHLLGIKLMPRTRNWQELVLYTALPGARRTSTWNPSSAASSIGRSSRPIGRT
ncbi:MAG TPA: hypothetical protein DEP84_09125 [Chloroflexi bacterium]|nr:hypothetical protein [Chloroflexota bacterium]